VFEIEIEQCLRCGGRLKVIASIEAAKVIARILVHRRESGEEGALRVSLGARAPPQGCSDSADSRRARRNSAFSSRGAFMPGHIEPANSVVVPSTHRHDRFWSAAPDTAQRCRALRPRTVDRSRA
jgi:hypothetical protein